ncbi:MAG: hypothetical protein GY788_17455 [bacterium]|nr:hypothetical protein [bacterium]
MITDASDDPEVRHMVLPEESLNVVQTAVATASDRAAWVNGILRFGAWLNPITSTPSAPLKASAFIDSYGPSLMPRTSAHQGVVTGLNVLAAQAVQTAVEVVNARVLPPGAALPAKLAVRAATGVAGMKLAAIKEEPEESLYVAGARSTGRLLRGAALGGAMYDVGRKLQDRYPPGSPMRPMLVSALGVAAVAYWATQRLATRREEIQQWPVPQVNKLPQSIVVANVVVGVGRGGAKAFTASRRGLINWAGSGLVKNVAARAANTALWGAGLSALYNAGVGYIGRSNEKVDPGYATPPSSPLMSGSEESLLPFEDLGQQGRRYVNDVATPELIEEVLGEPAVAQPIRVYVGYNTEPIYPTGRAELALAELDRVNAFDRSYLLLVAPTGTGWVDHTMIESAELLTRGDIATCCVQYGKFPSFLSLQKVALGRSQFRLLLWGIRERLRDRAPEDRPKVLIFGESLGAWASSDVVMYQGIAGFDHYGVDRALWFGLPGLAKWSRNGMARGSSELVPEGTVGVFDHPDQLAALSDEERDQLRAVILSHDNDPIAQLVPDIAIKQPSWISDGERGRNVSPSMVWIPIVTMTHTMLDAANAMVTVPGQFLSYGHDYRADTAALVRDAFHLPGVTEEQMTRIESSLRELEVERSARIKADKAEEAPPAPSQQTPDARLLAGVPLQSPRTQGALRRALTRRSGTIQ